MLLRNMLYRQACVFALCDAFYSSVSRTRWRKIKQLEWRYVSFICHSYMSLQPDTGSVAQHRHARGLQMRRHSHGVTNVNEQFYEKALQQFHQKLSWTRWHHNDNQPPEGANSRIMTYWQPNVQFVHFSNLSRRDKITQKAAILRLGPLPLWCLKTRTTKRAIEFEKISTAHETDAVIG